MLCKFSHTNSETLAQICAAFAGIRSFFQGVVFYWHTLSVSMLPSGHTAASLSNKMEKYGYFLR